MIYIKLLIPSPLDIMELTNFLNDCENRIMLQSVSFELYFASATSYSKYFHDYFNH